jgi:outer membrane protein assembly factor BamB
VRRGLASLSLAWLVAGSQIGCGDDTQGVPANLFPTEVPPARPGVWPQLRLDATHQGLSPPGTHLAADLVLAWQSGPYGIGSYSAPKSSPAVDDERVYVGVDDGQLVALDRRDGALVWRFATRRHQVELETAGTDHLGIHGSPAVDTDHVYIGDYSGWLYAVDKRAGDLVWEIQLGGSIGASPAQLGDFLFVAVEYPTPDGKVFVIAAATGEVVWASPNLGHHAHSSVSLDAASGLAFVGANNGVLFCFDYLRGRQRWSFQTGGPIKSTAAVVGDTVYVTSWDGRLYGLLGASGDERFQVATLAPSMSSPAVHEDRAYFGNDDGVLYATSRHDGTVAWTFATAGAIASSPTLVQESSLLVLGSRDQRVYLLDLSTGGLRQTIALGHPLSAIPVAVDDTLFLNDDAGTVYAFRSASADGNP